MIHSPGVNILVNFKPVGTEALDRFFKELEDVSVNNPHPHVVITLKNQHDLRQLVYEWRALKQEAT